MNLKNNENIKIMKIMKIMKISSFQQIQSKRKINVKKLQNNQTKKIEDQLRVFRSKKQKEKTSSLKHKLQELQIYPNTSKKKQQLAKSFKRKPQQEIDNISREFLNQYSKNLEKLQDKRINYHIKVPNVNKNMFNVLIIKLQIEMNLSQFHHKNDLQYKQELITLKRSNNTVDYYMKVTCGDTDEPAELLKHFQILNNLKKASQFTTLAPSKCANFSNKSDSFFLLQQGPSAENVEVVFTSLACKIEAIKSLIYSVYSIHDNDMIHTQIVPQNLLFFEHNSQQRFQLQCFPFLQQCPCQQSLNEQKYIFGPIHSFTSPEIRSLANRKALKILDPFKSDIFSLGCMIYFTLTGGNLPFISSATEQDFLYKNAFEQPARYIQEIVKTALNYVKIQINENFLQHTEQMTEIFSSFMTIVAHCLLPNPSERPAIDMIFHHDFLKSFN